MTCVVGFLAGFAAMQAWRVWRLETRARNIENNAAWLRECIADRPHRASLSALSERVAGDLAAVRQLATALGYEWKRTEAKEGWEKKATTVAASIVYGAPSFGGSTFGCIASGTGLFKAAYADRRKGDRRKPVPEIKVKQFCSSCDEKAVKRAKRQLEREINRPAKKPRRAH